MAKPKLEEMRIRPAKNGGHNIQHSYSAKPRLAKGAMTGGMMMDRPPSEEFNFGPKDHNAMMKHIAGALALKGLGGMPGAAPAAAPTAPASPDQEQAVAAD
jgi:hypothetical protein